MKGLGTWYGNLVLPWNTHSGVSSKAMNVFLKQQILKICKTFALNGIKFNQTMDYLK